MVYNSSLGLVGQALAANSMGATVSVSTSVAANQGYYIKVLAAPGYGSIGSYGLLVNAGSQTQAADSATEYRMSRSSPIRMAARSRIASPSPAPQARPRCRRARPSQPSVISADGPWTSPARPLRPPNRRQAPRPQARFRSLRS